MRQPIDRPLATPLATQPRAGFGALVVRLALAVLLLAGLTILASVALATNF